ncbi:MAG: nitrogen fixation protein NifE [Oscillospiraceae bacterium]|nr:nitrogen fixation protein NifE [Oscillospiraceae bacterium]
MGLYRFKPMPSGRMGIFWTVAPIREAAVVEFGCMGHNLYSGSLLRQGGIYEGYGAPLYTTYIDETDIAMGQTYRLEATLRRVVDTDRPKVVFLQPSAVPEVIGMDMYAIANLLADEFPETKLVPLGHGSFAISQHKGVEEALLAIVKALAEDVPKTQAPTYNVLGTCPDLFNFGADLLEIERMMRGAFGMEAVCRLSSDCSISDLRRIGSSHINLVIRREAIPAAEYLRKRFGTPYVYGRPYGIRGTGDWLRQVGETLGAAPSAEFIAAEERLLYGQIDSPYRTLDSNAWSYPEEAVLTIGGHYDVVKGIRDFAVNEMPLKRGTCWCDCPEMGDGDIPYFPEEKWIPVVESHRKGYLMFSGEALRWFGKNTDLMIANPDVKWRLHPYDPPLVGYRGAVQLVNLWVNEYTRAH